VIGKLLLLSAILVPSTYKDIVLGFFKCEGNKLMRGKNKAGRPMNLKKLLLSIWGILFSFYINYISKRNKCKGIKVNG